MAIKTHKNSSSKSGKRPRFPAQESGTTIKKVAARDARDSRGTRAFSNSNEVRKNLLDNAVDEAPSQDYGKKPSLFESGNKATILANFEEWIKLATDNKINVKNSWNFALIDYFHDLSVLKENNGDINFQKASATLDGCIKIYASRIDSVANETGKLLSGLVLSNERNSNPDGRDGLTSQDSNYPTQAGDVIIDKVTGLPVSAGGENDGSETSTRRRVNNRILETTLTSFDDLKVPAFDEEFSVDPLFKKALADFDEAGAKNLLLSMLHIQNDAKVVFDTTDEKTINTIEDEDISVADNSQTDIDMETEKEVEKSPKNNLLPPLNLEYHDDTTEEKYLKEMDDAVLNLAINLGLDVIPEEKELCKSIKFVRESIQDISKVKNLLENVVQESQPTENAMLDLKENSALLLDDTPGDIREDVAEINVSDNMDHELAEHVFMNDEPDVFAEPHTFDEQKDLIDDADVSNKESNDSDDSEEEFFDLDFEKNLFSEFNGIFKNKAWTGKDHWKVRNIKTKVSLTENTNEESNNESGTTNNNPTYLNKKPNQRGKKKKQRQHIDFCRWTAENEQMLLHSESQKVNGIRRIDMPLKNRKEPFYNLLPTDYKVTLEKMTVLFTRPLQKGNFFRTKALPVTGIADLYDGDNVKAKGSESPVEGHEEYWANVYENQSFAENKKINTDIGDDNAGLGNESNFNDLEAGMGLDFNDALGNDEGMGYENDIQVNQNSENALNLNAGLLLSSVEMNDKKERDLQKQATLQAMLALNATQKVNYSRVAKKVDIKKLKDNLWRCIESQIKQLEQEEVKHLKFTNLLAQLKTLYSFDAVNDLSTSFCFICLLHLANEHGFRIDKDEKELLDLTLVFES